MNEKEIPMRITYLCAAVIILSITMIDFTLYEYIMIYIDREETMALVFTVLSCIMNITVIGSIYRVRRGIAHGWWVAMVASVAYIVFMIPIFNLDSETIFRLVLDIAVIVIFMLPTVRRHCGIGRAGITEECQ